MEIEPRELGKILFEFEVNKQQFYTKYTLKKFLAWQIIRRPLYYSLIWHRFFEPVVKTSKKGKRNFLTAIIKLPFLLVYLLLKKRKIQTIIVASGVYKLERNEKGKDVNVFTDHWCRLFKPSEILLIEDKWGKKDPQNSDIRSDLDTTFIKVLTRFVSTFFRVTKWSHKLTAPLHHELTQFFKEKDFLFPENKRIIDDIIVKFKVDYNVYRVLFILFRPKILIAADSMARGMMAAARRSNLKIIELQHGLLDTYKPDYMISEKLNTYRPKLILPNRVAVFGDYYKSFLTAAGFWKTEEIVSIGNIRIDKYRGKKATLFEKASEKVILLPTQWNYFPETQELLAELEKALERVSFKLLIKTHPREPKSQVDFYKNVCDNFPGAVLFGNETSIYDLFIISDLVIGFDSTSLLESLALGVPTVTISTRLSPKGLHSYNADKILESSIKVAGPATIEGLVEKIFTDETFLKAWEEEIKEAGDYLYKENCLDNCKKLLDKL